MLFASSLSVLYSLLQHQEKKMKNKIYVMYITVYLIMFVIIWFLYFDRITSQFPNIIFIIFIGWNVLVKRQVHLRFIVGIMMLGIIIANAFIPR